jgi:hypothetical protein
MNKYLLFFLAAVGISYSSEWGPHYVSLFSGGSTRVLPRLSNYEVPCDAPALEGVACRVAYRVPRALFEGASTDSTWGLGVILHATEIGCADSFRAQLGFGDPARAGRTLDFLNVYQTVPLQALQCPGDFLVRVWSPESYRRYGLIDAPMVVGSRESVERIKTFVEFFRTQLLLLLSSLFVVVAIFNRVIRRLMDQHTALTLVERFDSAWIGFMLIFSGMAQTLLPIVSGSFFVTRLSNFCSVLAHFGPGIYGISRCRRDILKIRELASFLVSSPLVSSPWASFLRWIPGLSYLSLVLAGYALSPYFARALAPLFTVVGFTVLLFGVVNRDVFLAVFGLAQLLDSLKLFMVPFLPTSYLTLIFTLLAMTESFLQRSKRGASFVSALRWSHDQVETLDQDQSVASFLQSFAERFEIGRISLLLPQSGGNCEILMLTRKGRAWQVEQLFRDVVPPMFSHSLASREALWHIEDGSLFSVNLRKGEARKYSYEGRYFTILPLLQGEVPVGAISFTNYPERYAKSELARLELNTVANLLTPLLTARVGHQSANQEKQWGELCSSAANLLLELKNELASDGTHLDMSEVSRRITDILAARLGVGVYIGRLDQVSRRIHIQALSGHSDEVTRLYQKVEFYAVSHNEQGPLALAVNRRRTMTLGEIGWIRGVLHPVTLEIFDASGIQSCAAIPILGAPSLAKAGADRGEAPVWGVLWFESPKAGAFLPRMEAGLEALRSAVESILHHHELLGLHSRAKEALAGFVPQAVLERLISGQEVRQEEQGYLLMADVKDSTKISRSIGADRWNRFIARLTPSIERVASERGYQLQSVIWDAFCFTRPLKPEPEEVHRVVDLCREIHRIIDQECKGEFPLLIPEGEKKRVRFCLTHGDITRDVQCGYTKNWMIVGGAMASVSKLEQACKPKDGWLFAASSTAFDRNHPDWEQLEQRVNGTSEFIFSYLNPPPVADQAAVEEDDREPTLESA